MNPKDAAHAILSELKRQRREGIRRVFLEDETLSSLSSLLNQSDGPQKSLPAEDLNSDLEDFPKVTKRKKDKPLSPATPESPVSLASNDKVSANALPPPPVLNLPNGDKKSQWEWLKNRVLSCEVCNQELNSGGKVVFGEGNLDSSIFFCGEAPGAEEELQGKPFVGPAGDLLTRIIQAMGIERDQVYIGNVMNWRPRHNQAFGNRPPTSEEMSFCLPYLKSQVEIVNPQILVALGKTATDGLLGHNPQRRLSDIRGTWTESMGIPMMVTYHPSYLLHNPSKVSKRKVWEDMLMVMEKLEMKITEKQRSFFS